MCTRTRKRFTEPIDVRLYYAEDRLAESRRQLDSGKPIVALYFIMQALLSLERVRTKIDADALL
ncbi:hypothetical protein AMJ85_07480 [candidate division BRC1 bacterium SM23_51]|nr:MAG: hypothetical protein AMJ85_07480 [candidate division BRC1 bacterium SM23_51]